MTLLWLAVAALSVLAVLLVAAPLLSRRRRSPPSRRQLDLGIYREQLAEVDRDVERGLLGENEAEAARTEVKRRILAAGAGAEGTGESETGATRPARRRLAVGLVCLLAPLAAIGIYLSVGAPGEVDRPLAGRLAEAGGGNALDTMSAEDAVRALAHALESRPNDIEGWALLGRSYVGLQKFPEAVDALGRAHALAPDRADIASALGEAQVAAADGRVTDEARTVFAGALAADPREPRARYYLGLAKAQGGDVRGGLQDWVDLVALSPADAPWLTAVRQQIARAAGALGIDIASLGPSPEAEALGGAAVGPRLGAGEVEAAQQMTPEDRNRMIRSMVERLANRLQANPDDREGWLRLARAYDVLGETDKAADARSRADALAR
ncbi:MAG: c-type cytochrome biogenesis protein CcmI [Rhodospirillales bacterium]|nr:c-type cytochrome biogenesis protein CcmI [Rhodospirillales bacterium]